MKTSCQTSDSLLLEIWKEIDVMFCKEGKNMETGS